MLFTWAGYRKLAHFVEREIKRDLTQARSDRSIPLAGAETEQKRIAAQRPRREPDAGWKGTVTPNKEAKTAALPKTDTATAQPASTFDAFGEQKADNGRISLKTISPGGREETVTLELPRPAIAAAVIQLITRKDTGDRPSQMGDVLADDIGGGLVVLSSVTPAAPGPGGGARRVSPGQPYYQVWIKGERLPPRPGRADDFTWPRVDPEIVGLPEPRPARAPLKTRASGLIARAISAAPLGTLGRRRPRSILLRWPILADIPSTLRNAASKASRMASGRSSLAWLPVRS